MVRRAFAKILKSLREGKRLSQEELGFRADLHRTYVSQMERGLKSPTLDTLLSLSKVLELPLSEIIAMLEAELNKAPKKR